MKKLTLFLFLTLGCFLLLNAQAVREEASIDRIDKEQATADVEWLDDASDALIDMYVSFTVDDWWYVISYETLVIDRGRVYGRKAFLYTREIDSGNDWMKADREPLFRHTHAGAQSLTFDTYSLTPKVVQEKGTSYLENVTVNGEEFILAFIGMRSEVHDLKPVWFTQLIVFHKTGVRPDGSTVFRHYSHTLTQDKIFPIKRITDEGIIYGNNGEELTIKTTPTHIDIEYLDETGRGFYMHNMK